jgi:hypothetical protein
MNPLLHFLTATAVIGGLIVLRILAERLALGIKIRRNFADTACEETGCFRGCDPNSIAASIDSVGEKNVVKRSTDRAS